ncbi:ATP-binding protein [Lentzea atacamensis]|nr:ATP-binding protein [Lentzea atacamensis]
MRIETTDMAGVVVATPCGRLDLSGYPSLRDGLLKLAAASPAALVVRLGTGFEVPSTAMLAVFSTVRMQISRWPDIPLIVAAETDVHRRQLARSGVARFVSTVPDVASALDVAAEPPPRRLHRVPLPNSPTAPMIAREFVRDVCEQWQLPALRNDALLVVSELVENAVRHARSEPDLQVELRPCTLSIAVRDDDPTPAVQTEALPDVGGHRGLELVDRLSLRWGNTPSSDGGKIVWAVLARWPGE